jgi:hypothetical protein
MSDVSELVRNIHMIRLVNPVEHLTRMKSSVIRMASHVLGHELYQFGLDLVQR